MKQRFYEFNTAPDFNSSYQVLSFVDAARLISIEVGFQLPNATSNPDKYTVALIEEVDNPQQPLIFYAHFDTENDAVTEASRWRDRVANFRPVNSLYEWRPDDGGPQRILYYVDVSKISSVVVMNYNQNPNGQQWVLGLKMSGRDNSFISGLRFFATEAAVLVEAQLWRDRAEATK